jgi:single-strand DNA-binding protein
MPYVKGISKLVLLGRLGADAEFSKGRAGQEVARMTVCINTSWKDKHSGEWKEKAEWFHVNAWRHFAALSRRYGKKGTVVYVEGEPSHEQVGRQGWRAAAAARGQGEGVAVPE